MSALNDELADSNGDGYITALELGSFLSDKVTLESDNQQTPQLRNLTSDEGQFIFFIDTKYRLDSTIESKSDKKSFKLVITKYEHNFMTPKEFPPIISSSILSLIASAPSFIIEEPNIMYENMTSNEIEDWNKLMKTLNQLENASIGDSITTFWADEYYFKIFVQ